MKRLSLLTVAAAFALGACADEIPFTPSEVSPTPSLSTSSATTGNHLVVFGGRVPSDAAARIEAAGGTVVSTYQIGGAVLASGLDEDGVAELRASDDVTYVEPEPILELPDAGLEGVAAEIDATAIASPDDPDGAFFFRRQWNMRAIDAPAAWNAGNLGSSDVTVAIIDTGIDYEHADLAGHVDLSRSISLRPEDDAVVADEFPGAHPIADLHYHGTHVAATVVSNARAAAGVTSRTTLIGVKVCSAVRRGCRRIFEAIEHAVENGANIINMSLGGTFSKRDFPGFVSVINRYFTWANANGVLVVVSAGNAALDLDHDKDGYKTYCDAPNVSCVSATGPTARGSVNGPFENINAPAYFTNYGRSAISVAAPGGNTGNFVYAACSGFSVVIPICQTGTFIVGLRGTSMSAPHVSGVAALIAADGTTDPAQIRASLEGSAVDLGQAGVDPYYGRGLLNAANAVN